LPVLPRSAAPKAGDAAGVGGLRVDQLLVEVALDVVQVGDVEGARARHARHHLVLAAEQVEPAVDVGVDDVVVGDVVAGVGPLVHVLQRAVDVEQLGVAVGVVVVVGELGFPARAQVVRVFDERGAGLGVPVGPVLRRGGRDVERGLRAVVVREHEAAPHRVLLAMVLVRGAQGQHPVFADLAVHHAVEVGVVVVQRAQVGVAVLVRGHDARGPRAVGGQHLVDVDRGAVVVPRAAAQVDLAAVLVGRALAHVVDRARRVAHAGQQAVGAADQLDLVEEEGVLLADDRAPVVGHAQAVQLRELDVEAARVERGAVGLVLLDVDAGAHAQGLVAAGRAEVLHVLGVDGADRLRRVLDRDLQAGGALGDAVLALGRDDDRLRVDGGGGAGRGGGRGGGLSECVTQRGGRGQGARRLQDLVVHGMFREMTAGILVLTRMIPI